MVIINFPKKMHSVEVASNPGSLKGTEQVLEDHQVTYENFSGEIV